MSQQKDYFAEVYQQLNAWLKEIQQARITHIEEFIQQAKGYTMAVEQMSEEKLQQFIDNFKYDLYDFYKLNKSQAKDSVYLGLLNEALWDNLAKLTDKSQVEWAELVDDFQHDGIYNSGDFIGFGELQCDECDETIAILHLSKVAQCAKCGGNRFIRLPLKP